MARLAGNSKHYTIEYQVQVLDSKGKPTKYVGAVNDKFLSVTSVIDAIEKPALRDWFYKQGIQGVSELLTKFKDKTPHDYDSLISLMKTQKKGPYYTRDTAAKRGTDIHETFERLLKGENIEVDDDNYGLVSWWSHRGLSPDDIIASEVQLVSLRHRTAGTVDVIYREPETGLVVCCDLKTGRTVQPTYFVQGEAYKMMVAETPWLDTTVDKVTVLHVRPPDELPDGWKEYSYPEITEASFLAALELYRALPHAYWNPEEEA